MNDIYQKLADCLDQIPNGFPKTKSGVELKLLAKLFNPEEAKLASTLNLEHQSIKEIAEKNNAEESEVKSLLIGMVKKGLIELKREEGKGFTFFLIPFVVGFYERQNAKIDKEFAELFEVYYKESFHKTMIVDPSVHRIIPVEKTIPVNIDVMPYEKASTYLDNARSWGVLDCICRVQQKLIGKGCDHPVENCLVFTERPGSFDRIDDIKAISKEEALDILAEADKAGLVHSTSNTQEEVNYICNCCTCSCGVLRGIAEYGSLNSIARSDFYAVVDKNLCNACEICIDRCQFNALQMIDDICVVDTSFCYGCGLCVTSCSTGALSLEQKNPEELILPAYSEKEWREKREKAKL
ncbi:MAG: 4Fe-4S binding protein [Bacteroidota bacterium]|nr:4Fe-4S binding protein [Bacteroidota bacterium]